MRKWIHLSLFGLLIALSFSHCDAPEKSNNQKKEFELLEWSVADLQKAMMEGKLSAVDITQQYLDRIQSIDKGENGLNSVMEVNPDAIAIAEDLDKERAAGKVRGPLHGIPVLIKDNIDTGDKMSTSAGSLALKDSKASQDAYIVGKLRKSGAVLLGKTNLSEWANFRSTNSVSGWSSRGGQTRNPYYLDRNPCGSSSGSGVAVSANLCAIAIGTETNGSIVCPSSINGVVGIKPTVGLWSRSGIIPISETQDTAGPMARSEADAVTLLGALTGSDPRDSVTYESTDKLYTDYTQFLNPEGLKGKRIGVFREMYNVNADVAKIMDRSIEKMRSMGAIIVDSVEIGNEDYNQTAFDLLLHEFKDGVNKYLEGLGDNAPIKSVEELIAFNKNDSVNSMPYFSQELLELSQAKEGLESETYQQVLEKLIRLSRKEGLDATLSKYKLDAVVAPTNSPAWLTDYENGDKYEVYSSSPAARSGYPNITVPAGNVEGLPIGISFFSGPYQEAKLISIAYSFEQATKERIVPKMLSSKNDTKSPE